MQKLNTLLDQKSHSTWRLFSSGSVRSRSTVRETEGNALIDMDSKLGIRSNAHASCGVKEKQAKPLCAGCNKVIDDRYLLKAIDRVWHEDCLKCACCDCRLGEIGATLYTRANLILCKRDYLRLFGRTGFCPACEKTIPAFEMVMRAQDLVYHLECFACFRCHHRFCVGDKYFIKNKKIYCVLHRPTP